MGLAEERYPGLLTARSDDVVILTKPRPAGRDGNAGRLASGSHVTLAGWQRLRHPPRLLVVMVVAEAAAAVVVGGGVGTAAVAANSAKGSGGAGARVSSLRACRHNLRAPLVFARVPSTLVGRSKTNHSWQFLTSSWLRRSTIAAIPLPLEYCKS